MDLEAAITRLQAIVGGITGISQAPNTPPEKLAGKVVSVAYLRNVVWMLADASCLVADSGTIVLEVHWPRKNLPRDVAHGLDYVESIPKAVLGDPDLNNNIDGLWSMTGTYGVMDWNGAETIGWHYELSFGAHESMSSS